MLNVLTIAAFQAASIFFGATPQTAAPAAPKAATSLSADGGTGGWTGDIALDGGTGGWTGDIALDGGTGGWTGDIAALDGGTGGWTGDIV